ncbi:hypothetical protein GVX82_02515 [Patescibacteria group bacterium]|jgi:predicted transcriptional regulator|nr:hypothetical protein [Patescibacteria group bacterium]
MPIHPSALLGLSELEGAIYLAILAGGEVTQSDIAKTTGRNRTSLYRPIRALLAQDLIRKIPRGKRIFYAPSDPNKLLSSASQKLATLESLLPTLVSAYQHAGSTPTISVREGPASIYQALYEVCERAHYLKSFASPANFLGVLSRKQANELVRLMEQREMTVTTITSSTPENLHAVRTFRSPALSWRAMPQGINFPIEVTFSYQTTLIISWSHQFVVTIESSDITEFVEAVYDFMWHHARSTPHSTGRRRRR